MRLNGLMVPSHKFRGQDSTLSCLYDMEGEQLYSVKWYKDDHEFFRFIPADRDQKITIFRLPGVKVDQMRSDQNKVTLKRVDLDSAGVYRCEISAEAPLFNTVSRSSEMGIIVLPKHGHGPLISGGLKSYHIGERVMVNCTSPRSKPAARLRWYINGTPASPYMEKWYPTIHHDDGLETAILGLDMQVTRETFYEDPSSVSGPVLTANPYKDPPVKELLLQCKSEIITEDIDTDMTETHHQKMAIHSSKGYLYNSGGTYLKMENGRVFSALCFLIYFLNVAS